MISRQSEVPAEAPGPELTPFEIRLSSAGDTEVWIRVNRCAHVAEAQRWVEAEGVEVEWDGLLRGRWRP